MDIPGWTGEEYLNVLSKYSSMVPESGNILEIGALFGRSTYAIGHNKLPTVNLYVIDLWNTVDLPTGNYEYWYHDMKCGKEQLALVQSKETTKLESDDFFSLYDFFTKDVLNKKSYRGSSLQNIDNFPKFDLIIHDGAHDYETVIADLNHWLPKLKHDGLIIIDDYDHQHFREVVNAVDKFVLDYNFKTEMITGRNILLYR